MLYITVKTIKFSASLNAFLKSLNIDPDRKHSVFGNVKDFIHVTMVKQKYIVIAIDQKRLMYSWGIRAEKEISKHELLKFVAKVHQFDLYNNVVPAKLSCLQMYKDREPKSWRTQFEVANEQSIGIQARQVQHVEEMQEE